MATLMEELNSGLGLILAIIAIGSAWGGIVATWVKFGARMDAAEGRLHSVVQHLNDDEIHQTVKERQAIADLVLQKFDSHEKFDLYRFDQIDKKFETIMENTEFSHAKMDAILAILRDRDK